MSTPWQQDEPDKTTEIARLKRGIVFRERLLIEHLDVEPDQVTLAPGCGYGAIGLAAACKSASDASSATD